MNVAFKDRNSWHESYTHNLNWFDEERTHHQKMVMQSFFTILMRSETYCKIKQIQIEISGN